MIHDKNVACERNFITYQLHIMREKLKLLHVKINITRSHEIVVKLIATRKIKIKVSKIFNYY